MDLGSWNFKRKPSGLWKRLLHDPVYLYRAHLGFLLGERIIVITHIGRRSGRRYQTPVEVVEHLRQAGEYIVCSGTGPHADWYQNLLARPAAEVEVRNRRWQPTQRPLTQSEAAACFARYEGRHPRTAAHLLQTMGKSYDGTDAGRLEMMAEMPMIAFSDHEM